MSRIAYEERGSGPPPGVSDGDNDDDEDDGEEALGGEGIWP